MSEVGPRRPPQDQSSGSGHTVTTSRHPYITDPIASKHVCFYKSGDPQFSGLRMAINSRTFKTFDALLDSLSKKVPLPFGVRNITTPRGVHAVHTLDELEDGKAYICSDQRKVKPINMAAASKKLPPWYHARPMSARRRALQLAKQNPGRPMRKKKSVTVRTPKRLMVFRNGDPSVKHNMMLQKRTTPTFEALLDYVSELMHFPVVKLHTPDGRRVDGLPALILCSGIVVAAGREAFKSANYKTQRSSAPTWLPARRMASKRLKQPAPRKKKSVSSSKSHLFSSSSERYFVNQIHHSVAGSQCDLPSNNTGSVVLEAGHFLESVAETDADTYNGHEGADNMPGDDDIEKSFRVNQDGSMTVEMKVRLTIKEEETIHWTTTLTRSSVASQLSVAESELEIRSPESNALPPTQPNTMGTINGYNAKKDDHDDEDDMSPEASGLTSVEGDDEDNSKIHVSEVSLRRAPTPGPRRSRQKQASLENINTPSGDEIQENIVGSYSYRETTKNGEVKEEYCMVRQCSSRPVPKPRRVGSMDINNYNKTQSTFKSGAAEILQIQNGEEEVRESVMQIYEQQTCQDNFLANSQYSVQGVSTYGLMYGRPATSETARFSSSNDLEMELERLSTASESISMRRADQSLSSDFTIPTFKAGGSVLRNRVLNVHKTSLSKPTKDNETPKLVSEASKENSTTKAVKKAKKRFSKPKLRKYQVRKSTTPDKRRKESSANSLENNKRVKTGGFSRNASIRKIYGPKPARSRMKNKLKGKEIKLNIENPKELSVKELNVSENGNETSVSVKKKLLHVSFPTEAQGKGTMKRQRSMQEERRIAKECHDLSLPALLSSSSNINEYVENWLEKALPTVYPDPVEETLNVETPTMSQVETEGDIVPDVSEINCEMDIEEDESCFLKEKTQIPSSPSLVTAAFPNRTFENIATQTNLTMENTTIPCPSDPSLQNTPLHIHTIQERLPTNPSAENPPLSNGFSVFPPAIISLEKPSPSDSPSLEQTSMPIKISVEKLPIPNDLSLENTSVPNSSLKEKIPVSNCLSPEKTPLPAKTQTEKTPLPAKTQTEKTPLPAKTQTEKTPLPAKTQTEKTPLSNKVSDGSSVASSPSYLMCSSPSSLGDEEQPLSSSPSSDEAPSTNGHVFEKTLFNHSTLKEPPSPKLATKKTRLLSNLSLEKQLSFRKASAEKSSISSYPTVEKVLVDKAPISNGLSSDKTSHPAKILISNNVLNEASLASSPSCFISTSPTNRTSDERALSIPPSSEEDLSPTGHVLEKTTLFNHSTLRETSSPKLPTKKTRLISNVSLEKQLSLRRLSVDKSSLSSNPTLEKAQLSNPVQITIDKTQLPNSHSLEETSPPNKSSLPSDSTSENTQLSSSPQQGRTPLPRHISLKTQLHNNFSPERTNLPTLMTRNKSAPSNLSSEKIPVPSNRTLKNRLSPYSQTLEIVSPPTRLKAKKKPVSRNHSLEIEPSPVSPTLKRTPLPRKGRQTPLSPKSTPVHLNSSMKKTPTPPSPALVNHEETNGDDNLSNSDQGDSTKVTAEEPLTKAQIPSYREQLPPQPDMKPVLEKLYFSIRSIRQITHNNRPSCLEKSNSLPDFSSHVASTFGSSSKALLAFLSVITLKESFTNWNIPELNANSVSCAEALKMIESLREIANIEDAEELKASLSDLQKSTSSQLLQSWKGFQELNDKVRSRSSALNSSEHDLLFETHPVEDYNIKEKALDIDELINELDVPEKVKEALAALSTGVSMSMDGNEINISKKANEKVESSPEGKVNANSTAVPKEEAEKDHVLNKEATVDVKSIIKTFTNIHHPKEVAENTVSPIPESPSSRQEQYFSSKEHSFKEDYICHRNRQAANKEGAELEQDNWEEEEAKCTYKQVNHDEEQTSSEIEQAYSLVLHDGYLDKPACSVEAREKDGDIQAGYVEEKESLKKEQEYYIENPPSHVGQEVTSMELQVSCKECIEKDHASSEEEQKCHVEDQISHVESESKYVEEEWLKEEQQCHIDDQPSYCGLQVSREERESTPEEQASSEEESECHIGQNHEDPEAKCLDLQDSSENGKSTPKEDQASSDAELERHVASKPTHEEPEVKCTDVKVSSEENMSSFEEDQASLEEELECHIENQPSHEEKGVKCTDVKVSSEENMSSFEEDQASLEEELKCHIENQPSHEEKGVKCTDVKVSSEENMSSFEEDQASLEEELECHIENQPSHEEKGVKCIEMQVSREEREYTPEDDRASLDEEEENRADNLPNANAHINVKDEQTHLWMKQTTEKEIVSTVIEMKPSLVKQHSSDDRMDKDSGKDSEQHVSFEQKSDTVEEANVEDNRRGTEKKQVRCEEKLPSSEAEHVGIKDEPYTEDESYAEYEESFVEKQPFEEDTNYETTEAKTTNRFEEPLPSVAERVKLLDKKIADVEQRKSITLETTGIKPFAHIKAPAFTYGDDLTSVSHLSNEQAELVEEASEMQTTNYVVKDVKEQDKAPVHTCKRTTWPIINTSETVVMSPPAPQSSSLAFSYDGCITREPEGNRVKKIKEMFMAKSIVDIQYGQTRLTSPNSSDLSDNRPGTSDGSHRSLTSTEMSSGEDDSVKKSITKGFVRRTIERLYGKKDTNEKVLASESQPISVPRPKSREFPGKISLSPFHNARTKVMLDLSYFNATSSFDTYSEPTRCIAFNTQVGPGDCVPIEENRWLLRECVIRKSVSEPINIYKNTSALTEDECKDAKEDVPYSLFGHTDREDMVKTVKPFVAKCTYFNLPHGCDSDPYQDDLSSVSKGSAMGDISKDSKDNAEEPKLWAEKNGTLPDFSPTDFKMPDNKVHPLIEGPGGGKVVVVQPGKGQSGKGQTDVKKIPQEPDALEMLYFSCGQHCPIL
uniref:Doublecortin domain-containing protein n=1 Tax=Oncorhynchus tshawytscha TaxID=74940 RepID=A0AAZ3SV40_ONCTS